MFDNELHNYRLDTGKGNGLHTFQRGKKRISTKPGEIVEATPQEIGKSAMSRFTDLGVVKNAKNKKDSSERRTHRTA